MIIFAPKNRANIRVVHLLHPQDLLIYTALVLIIKDDVESERLSKTSQRVFSFRVNKTKADRLYDSQAGYELFTRQLNKKANRSNNKFVGVADIADFYPRIYQHRLENVIESVANSDRATNVARVLVKKLISKLMKQNSYGIPVGPYASRILAEALLIDVDSFLCTKKINFVRWVDDFHIFCKSEYEAQSSIFHLGEWLYSKHGLTLQSAKTKIYPIAKYKINILDTTIETPTQRNAAITYLKKLGTTYKNEGEPIEPLSEQEVQILIEELKGVDLISMLEQSVSDKSIIDYGIVKYVLTKLPLLPSLPDHQNQNVLDIIIENAGLLYPVSEQIAKYVLSFSDLKKSEKKKIATKLLKPLKSRNNPPPDYYAMWILFIFSTSDEWNHIDNITEIYQNSRSEVVRRYAALAISRSGSRNEALIIRDDISSASPLLKLAILESSKKLGKDEKIHWKRANRFTGIIEKII